MTVRNRWNCNLDLCHDSYMFVAFGVTS
jgi:hypothetical protein